jgi:hypothetical protein
MGIKGGHRGNNRGFGNLCNLKPVVPASSVPVVAAIESAEEEDIDKIPNTKILRISNEIYEKFLSHSQKFYDVVSYNEIIDNLLKCYEEHNQDKRWRDIES